jgi:hypothetical protein
MVTANHDTTHASPLNRTTGTEDGLSKRESADLSARPARAVLHT